MATPQTVRRWIITASVAAITATGAIYGASLKDQYDATQHNKRVRALPIEEQIAGLEAAKAEYARAAEQIEQKMEEFKRKQKGEVVGERYRRRAEVEGEWARRMAEGQEKDGK